MSARPIAFTGARLVLPDDVAEGTLAVEDGCIASLGRAVGAAEEIDCEGDYLLPGLVEVHTDHLEKQLMPRAGVEWPALSAVLAHDAQIAASGITTVLDAVAIGNSPNNPDRMAFLNRGLEALETAVAHGMLRAAHGLHLRCEVSHADMDEHFLQHRHRPGVRMVSLMDHTPGARQYTDIARTRAYIQADMGLTGEEAAAEIRARQDRSGRYADGHRRAIAQAALALGHALASHDDETDAHVAEAKALGATISEFPTTLAAAQAARGHGMQTVAGAPNIVRGGSHSGNVSAVDLFVAGCLDILSSDYMPISLLQAPFALSRRTGREIWETVRLVTAAPAAAAGYFDRGRLEAGLRADLIRVRIKENVAMVRGAWRGGMRIL